MKIVRLSLMPTLIFFLLGSPSYSETKAECLDRALDFSSECNSECPMDEGGPPCHLLCQVGYDDMVEKCNSIEDDKSDSSLTPQAVTE